MTQECFGLRPQQTVAASGGKSPYMFREVVTKNLTLVARFPVTKGCCSLWPQRSVVTFDGKFPYVSREASGIQLNTTWSLLMTPRDVANHVSYWILINQNTANYILQRELWPNNE